MKAKNEGHALTSAGEDYLEAIYCVMLEHPGEDSVRSVDVSERLNVTKASVNKALSALKDGGFVDPDQIRSRGAHRGGQDVRRRGLGPPSHAALFFDCRAWR